MPPRLNSWLLNYLSRSDQLGNRYAVDRYLLEAGYEPEQIEKVWQEFSSTPNFEYVRLVRYLYIVVIQILLALLVSFFIPWYSWDGTTFSAFGTPFGQPAPSYLEDPNTFPLRWLVVVTLLGTIVLTMLLAVFADRIRLSQKILLSRKRYRLGEHLLLLYFWPSSLTVFAVLFLVLNLLREGLSLEIGSIAAVISAGLVLPAELVAIYFQVKAANQPALAPLKGWRRTLSWLRFAYIHVSLFAFAVIGGVVFDSYSVFHSDHWSSLMCPTTQTCLLTDGDSTALTSDGGQSWQKRDIQPNYMTAPIDYKCITEDKCYLVFKDKILLSSDQGRHFETFYTLPAGQQLEALQCPDSKSCLLLSIQTTDSGLKSVVYHFTDQQKPGAPILSALDNSWQTPRLECLNNHDCYLAAQSDPVNIWQLFTTTDGGSSWSQYYLTTQGPNSAPYSKAELACSDIETCSVFDDKQQQMSLFKNAKLVNFIDLSATLKPLLAPTTNNQHSNFELNNLVCPASNLCLAATSETIVSDVNAIEPAASYGNGPLFISHDGGQNWQIQPDPLTKNLQKLSCVDALNCFARDYAERLIFTNDAGYSWQKADLGDSEIYSVSCVDKHNCFALDQSNQIFATSDGGASWHIFTSDNRLLRLKYLDWNGQPAS